MLVGLAFGRMAVSWRRHGGLSVDKVLGSLAGDPSDRSRRDGQDQQHALDQHAHARIEALQRERLVEQLEHDTGRDQ